MNTYGIRFTHEGRTRTELIEAPDAKAAKRILYATLGVKRLIGTATDLVGKAAPADLDSPFAVGDKILDRRGVRAIVVDTALVPYEGIQCFTIEYPQFDGEQVDYLATQVTGTWA